MHDFWLYLSALIVVLFLSEISCMILREKKCWCQKHKIKKVDAVDGIYDGIFNSLLMCMLLHNPNPNSFHQSISLLATISKIITFFSLFFQTKIGTHARNVPK